MEAGNNAMLGISLTIFAFLTTQIVYSSKSCPSPNCECRGEVFTCYEVPDMDRMKEIMKTVAKSPGKVRTFNLKDTKMPALPETMFSGTKLASLRFENVELPFLVPPLDDLSPFSDLKELRQIEFKNASYLYNWNWTMFSNLKDLERFTADNSLFVYIRKSFSDIKSPLKLLHLVDCKVTWIEDGAFASFKQMSKLELSNNEISSFSRSILPSPASKLLAIDLSKNKLNSLAEDFFAEMPGLSVVRLKNNNLRVLPKDLVNALSKRITLHLEGNPFVCDCDLLWTCKQSKLQVDYGLTKCDGEDTLIKDVCESKSQQNMREECEINL